MRGFFGKLGGKMEKLQTKNNIRKQYKLIRNSLDKAFRKEASEKICRTVTEMREYALAKKIMCYSAIFSEVSVDFIAYDAQKKGKTVLLPVTDIGANIIYGAKTEGDFLVKGAYSIYEPADKTPCPLKKSDIVIVPGLAYNKKGFRVGYGKGYYDRFFAQNPNVIKIGVCFSAQICKEDFEQEGDVMVDIIVTEKGVEKIEA